MLKEENNLKKLKRIELLELLLEQTEENENLKKEIEALKDEVYELRRQLEDRRIRIEKAGTIAEASFILNGVFESAEKAAEQYLESLKDLHDRQEVQCKRKEAAAEAYSQRVIFDAQKRCDIMLEQTKQACRNMEEQTMQQCREIKGQFGLPGDV